MGMPSVVAFERRGTPRDADVLPVNPAGGCMVVVDAARRVTWASPKALALLAEAKALNLEGHRLCAGDLADQKRLDALMNAAVRGEGGEMILFDADSEGVLVSASPRGGTAWLKLSALRPAKGTADRFAALFGLTPAEARLAEAMLAGHDPADCAVLFGVSRTTIRSQLDSLFDKTGRRRQAALMALLAAVAAA